MCRPIAGVFSIQIRWAYVAGGVALVPQGFGWMAAVVGFGEQSGRARRVWRRAESRPVRTSASVVYATTRAVTNKPQIVVFGLLTRWPVAGPMWEILQYLIGLERRGYEAYYVEAHRRAPRMFMSDPADHEGPAKAATFLDRLLRRYGFGHRWAYHSGLGDERVFGLGEQRLRRLYRDAALIVNLNGGTEPLPEHRTSGRHV